MALNHAYLVNGVVPVQAVFFKMLLELLADVLLETSQSSDLKLATACTDHVLQRLWGSFEYPTKLLEQLKWIPGSQIKKRIVGTS